MSLVSKEVVFQYQCDCKGCVFYITVAVPWKRGALAELTAEADAKLAAEGWVVQGLKTYCGLPTHTPKPKAAV